VLLEKESQSKKIKRSTLEKAFKSAFPYTLPILTGFLSLGIAYGIYMNASGFSPIYPFLMSFLIFAGSVEFITVGMLMGAFDPIGAFMIALMVNARHLFYGISMLDKFKGTGLKKYYLIYGMCDESFSINYAADIPEDVDKGWFMFFVTMLNQIYWVLGATIGGVFGTYLRINTKGIEFVMTALFVVLFMDQWVKDRSAHKSSVIGLGASIICLIIFGPDKFMIPSMIAIILILTLGKETFQND